MRIAQIAPLTEAVPPKLYGGTERVVSWLTEELVALGHEVTLFASGDSLTRPSSSRCGRGLCASTGRCAIPIALHMTMLEQVRQRARRVRHPAFPPRLLSVLAVLAPVDAVRHHAARPARPARASAGVSTFSLGARGLDLRMRSGGRCRRRTGCARSITACRQSLLTPQPVEAQLSRLPRPHRAGEGGRPRDPHRAALRHAAEDRRQGRSRRPRLFRRRDPAAARRARRRVYRRDRRRREIGLPQRRHRRCWCRSTGRSRSAW